jgi:hypothetical protein
VFFRLWWGEILDAKRVKDRRNPFQQLLFTQLEIRGFPVILKHMLDIKILCVLNGTMIINEGGESKQKEKTKCFLRPQITFLKTNEKPPLKANSLCAR